MENISLISESKDAFAEKLSSGGGLTGELFRSVDWSKNPLGVVSQWSPVLKSFLTTLFHSKQPMFIWWGADLVQFYNDAYLPSFGQGKHPVAMGQRGKDCWGEIWPIIEPQINSVMKNGVASWNEKQLVPIHRNGKIEDVWWTYGYSPIFDQDGSVGGTLVTCTEVTNQINAERILKADREKLHSMFMQAPMPICVLEGREHVFTLANQEYCELVDRQVIGKPVREAFSEEEGGSFFPILDSVLATGEPFIGREMVMPVKTRDGSTSEHYFNFGYHPIRDETGTPSGILALIQDVTEHVRTRKEIEVSEAQFRNLANSIPQLAWMAEPNGSIYWYNKNWYDYSGTLPEDMEGWGWQKLHDPEVLPKVLERWTESIATGQTFEMSFPLKSASGEFRTFLTRVNPVRDADGKVIRWFGTNTDIHDQAKELTNLEKEKRLREQFVNTLTHDLKNPLAAAKISAQLISRVANTSEKVTSLTGRIIDNLARADQMINNLLDANRIKAGEPLNLTMRETGLVSLVGDLIGNLSTTHGDRFILEAVDPVINGIWNPEAIYRVIENLCLNAIKYGDERTPVRVMLSQQADRISISVQNRGNLIAAADLPKLFNPYQRGKSNSGIQGWGLGLTLVKGFTEAHGGSVAASSDGDIGTIFTIALPRDSSKVTQRWV